MITIFQKLFALSKSQHQGSSKTDFLDEGEDGYTHALDSSEDIDNIMETIDDIDISEDMPEYFDEE